MESCDFRVFNALIRVCLLVVIPQYGFLWCLVLDPVQRFYPKTHCLALAIFAHLTVILSALQVDLAIEPLGTGNP
jgi:hypothetical protein